jgi:hypothetical protein
MAISVQIWSGVWELSEQDSDTPLLGGYRCYYGGYRRYYGGYRRYQGGYCHYTVATATTRLKIGKCATLGYPRVFG